MIVKYVDKLIENLPDNFKNTNKPIKIDLVLDGGLFNGSYLLGALYFLKGLENKKYITIERISGCSIGSIVGFLYLIDKFDIAEELYSIFFNDFKKNFKLENLKKLKYYLNKYISDDICDTINDKLFISYYDILNNKKIIKSNFKNKNQILKTLICSCFVPILIDGNILFKDKYLDGLTPFIFNKNKNKILYLDLFGYDKLFGLINVKNENTNFHRILSGLLDTHTFFIKQTNTQMCSYVDDWNIFNFLHFYVKNIIEYFIVKIITFIVFINKYKFINEDNILYKIGKIIFYDIYIILLKTYCL